MFEALASSTLPARARHCFLKRRCASRSPLGLAALSLMLASAGVASAQDNYEIQVYPYETVPKGATMLELHSNYTAIGRAEPLNGVSATNHAVHETVEI